MSIVIEQRAKSATFDRRNPVPGAFAPLRNPRRILPTIHHGDEPGVRRAPQMPRALRSPRHNAFRVRPAHNPI